MNFCSFPNIPEVKLFTNMKNLHVMSALLLLVLFVADTEGWWFWRRRPSHPSCGYSCWTTCGIRCSWPRVGCRYYCYPRCGYRCRGKREAKDKNMVSLLKPRPSSLLLPAPFNEFANFKIVQNSDSVL